MLFNGLVGAVLGLLGTLGFHQMSRMFILQRELIVNVHRHMTPRRDRVIIRKEFEYNGTTSHSTYLFTLGHLTMGQK
jgi:hypothetical protein